MGDGGGLVDVGMEKDMSRKSDRGVEEQEEGAGCEVHD